MTPLGEPVVFYLRYMAEMSRLCFPDDHGGEPDLTGLKNADRVKDMARIVGDLACERVADFLELCAKGIEEHFTGQRIGTVERKKTRAFMKRNWDCGLRVDVASVPGGSFWCGLFISAPPEIQIPLTKGVSGVVIPWVWSKGGRKGADTVWEILDRKADSRAGEGLVEESASVALARIPIKAEPPETFNVDREPLIAEAVGTIARIGIKQAKAIAKFVAGLKETDDD
jgi:hypothetical protein